MERKKASKLTTLKNLQCFFGPAFLTTATKIEVVRNLPLEGPGTVLANPSIYLEICEFGKASRVIFIIVVCRT